MTKNSSSGRSPNGNLPSALVVDDHPTTRQALADLVEMADFEVRTAKDLSSARVALEGREFDLVLTDLVLPDGQGTELAAEYADTESMEIVVITGQASVETAVEALRLGATDYLTKPVDQARLDSILERVRRSRSMQHEISSLRDQLRDMGRFGPMVGTSDSMQKIYRLIEKVAPTEATVLLVGESGTGKELAAATVHQLSRRSGRPFVAVNCGAVSASLIESELFGHERGAFTGADRQREGYFEKADGGTLFLDEVTEMPAELQVKLLRVLETGQVIRVGGNDPVSVDVRVIAATNRQPQEAVDAGQLRQDLLFRLKVFPIDLPPLRRRLGDVEILAQHFLRRHNESARDDTPGEPGEPKSLTGDALAALRAYPWPGNVRELRNAVERAYIVADDEIALEHLPEEVKSGVAPGSSGSGLRFGMSIAEVEKELIFLTLEQLDGDKRKAADLLGISLKTLYNRLNAYKEEDGEGDEAGHEDVDDD